jgi:hypothetical protein
VHAHEGLDKPGANVCVGVVEWDQPWTHEAEQGHEEHDAQTQQSSTMAQETP